MCMKFFYLLFTSLQSCSLFPFIYLFIFFSLCIGSFHNHSSDPPDSEWFYSVVDFEHVCNGCIPPPWGSLMNQLKDFPLYISQLNKHIRKFSVNLSKKTHLYLMMLNNLTDLTEDLKLSVFWRTLENSWIFSFFIRHWFTQANVLILAVISTIFWLF